MGKQAVNEETATLWASNFSRTGYGFAGWNTRSDGTGTSYGPNETITLPADMSEGMRLYAMWVQSAGNLQDWEGCYNMSVGQVTALTDTRDNDTYAVAKLADGNCWLIENLRLGNVDGSNNAVVLSSSNTHNPSLPLTNSLDQSTGDILTSSNSLSASQDPAVNNWCTNNNSICDNQSKIFRGNVTNPVEKMVVTNTNIRSYGTYYNWYSATAGNGVYGLEGVVSGDICPSNWFLPYGGVSMGKKGGNTSGGYYYLSVALGATEDSAASSAIVRSFPANFVYGGQITGLSVVSRGGGGAYWTSTGGVNGASSFNFAAASFNPGNGYNNKNYGRQVRCVTKSIQSHEVTVNFDDGVDEIVLTNNEHGTKTVSTSGTTITLKNGVEYTISATYKTEKGFDGWTTTANGTLGSTSSAETTYTVSGTATLTLSSKRACMGGYICYDKNYEGESAAGGGMKNQEVDGDDDTLWNSNFYRDGYGFAGWNTKPDGSGTMYGPTETIHYGNSASAIAESGLMLYAVWVQSTGYLQDFYCPNNTTMPIGTVTALTDMRDNQVYTVAKLADGKCWMTENLRLNSEYTVGNNINDASITNEELAQGYGKTDNFGNFIGLADSEGGTFKNRTTANSLYSTDGSTTVSIGSTNSASNRMPRYNNYNLSNPGFNMDGFLKTTVAYRNGNFYTGSAATASTDYYDTIDQNIATSICPTGWRLPTSGRITHAQDGEFYVLAKLLMNGTEPNRVADGADYAGYEGTVGDVDMGVLASERLRTYPTNFTLAGDIAGDEMNPSNQGEYGAYWSSTVGLNDLMQIFTLEVYQNSVYPSKMIQTYLGQSVRCVAEYTGLEGYNYMQDFADLTLSEMDMLKASMEENRQYTIKDSRDNKYYHISKLADGNIWMTQNLDLEIDENTTYTSADTDIPSDWTPVRSTYEPTANQIHSWCNGGTSVHAACTNDTPESYDPGDLVWNKFESDWSDWKLYSGQCNSSDLSAPYCDESLDPTATYIRKYGIRQLHLGNYYNFAAAVASNDASVFAGADEVVNQSICPAGWTLPQKDASTNDFTNLWSNYGFTTRAENNGDKLWDQPINYNLSGSFDSVLMDLGDNGVYWSSVTQDAGRARYMEVFGPAVDYSIAPNVEYASRSNGYSVRCVARTPVKTIEDLGYMQDFATLSSDDKAEVLDSMTEGEQYQLIDSRDDKVYYISKLADGNVWMTQNLDFDIVNGGADINSTNTDVPANWTGAGHLNNTYATEHDSWERLGRYSESYDAGDLCWDGSIGFNDDAEWYQYTIPCTDRHYHVGNYYNWTAAVALEDSSMYFAPEESTGNDNVDVDQSICPAGWMLPKDGISSGSGSYEYLVNQQHLTDGASGNIHQAPTYFIYGGRHYGGIPDYFGGEGLYITSVFLPDYYNSTGNMTFGENGEEPIQFNVVHGNDDGYTIRCLVRK
ncbi:MAG: FISUMP domain-containing protein [Candidatus Saccharibacteria bacterium]|nr:FISUMP domain-containing protein [Candidatus Saccharibacteria bacterium]